jgi:cytochrome c oxidase assembly factor CtaG
MGRNLYILAATLGLLAVISLALSFTGIVQHTGSPSDAPMWRMLGFGLLCVALFSGLGGVLSTLFEQAERRDSLERERSL